MTVVSLSVQVKTLPVTNSSQIAAIGYCLGGSAIIELARAYPNGTDGLLGKLVPLWAFVFDRCNTRAPGPFQYSQ